MPRAPLRRLGGARLLGCCALDLRSLPRRCGGAARSRTREHHQCRRDQEAEDSSGGAMYGGLARHGEVVGPWLLPSVSPSGCLTSFPAVGRPALTDPRYLRPCVAGSAHGSSHGVDEGSNDASGRGAHRLDPGDPRVGGRVSAALFGHAPAALARSSGAWRPLEATSTSVARRVSATLPPRRYSWSSKMWSASSSRPATRRRVGTLTTIRLVNALGVKVSVLPRLLAAVGSSVRLDELVELR